MGASGIDFAGIWSGEYENMWGITRSSHRAKWKCGKCWYAEQETLNVLAKHKHGSLFWSLDVINN